MIEPEVIVALRPITRDNLWAVVDLKLHPDQEQLIEDNVASIANAYVKPTFVPLGLNAGDELVGLAMYGKHLRIGDAYLPCRMRPARTSGETLRRTRPTWGAGADR